MIHRRTSTTITLGFDEVRGFDYDYAYDPIGNRTSATYYDEQGEAVASAYTANALNQYTSRTVPGNVQVRGEADPAAIVTVNENPTWRYPSLSGGEVEMSEEKVELQSAPRVSTSKCKMLSCLLQIMSIAIICTLVSILIRCVKSFMTD